MYMVLCLPVVNPLPLVGDGNTSVWGPRGVLRVARLGAVAGVLQAPREMSTVHEASAQVGHTWVGKCGGPRPDSSSSPDHPTLTTQIPQQCAQPQGGTKKVPLQADTPTASTEAPPMLETEGLPSVNPAQTEGPAEPRGRRVLTRKLG